MELKTIPSLIYEIRGKQVMLDFDLAKLYQVETRALNQAVKRNASRFPADFMFKLKVKEWKNMSSQIVMTSASKRPKNELIPQEKQSGLNRKKKTNKKINEWRGCCILLYPI